MNRGAAFGMFSESRWVFMSASVIFIAVLIYVLKTVKIDNKLFNISVALILGGGIGNMIDRVFLGYVVDFIEFTFMDFAVFNIADSAISIGSVCLAVYFIFFDKTFFSKSPEVNDDKSE
jgi:signal peptidase II